MDQAPNKLVLVGEVGQEPTAQSLPDGRSIAQFSLVTAQPLKQADGKVMLQNEKHPIKAYGHMAQFILKYVHKGAHVIIEGNLAYQSYEDKNGQRRYTSNIVLSDVILVGRLTPQRTVA